MAASGRRATVRHKMESMRLPKAQDEIEDDNRPVLIVIGGGFAGTLCIRKMCKEFRTILIDAKEYFEYYPGICRAYADPKEHRLLSCHYQSICDGLDVEFCWGEATKVDPDTKKVTIKGIAVNDVTDRMYDYLAVCTGSQYGIDMIHQKSSNKGSECLWYPTFLQKVITTSSWENLDERFLSGRRKHIEKEYKTLQQMNKDGATILVIGAGFVGVEFATEVKHFFPNMEVVIAEARGECVGVMPKSCIDYCQNYLDKAGIKCIYNAVYKDFLSPEDSMIGDIADQELGKLAKEWGCDEPSRVYMAVGLRPINQFMPGMTLTPGKRGGWIQANIKQQVLSKSQDGSFQVVPNVFAAGNCIQSIEGPNFPKNAFPGEDMAAVACHNIRVLEAAKNSKFGGCFGFFQPKKMIESHWGWGTGLCATSLGPNDATLVFGGTTESGSGRTILTGMPAALNKEFVRYTKIDQVAGGWFGSLVWKLVH